MSLIIVFVQKMLENIVVNVTRHMSSHYLFTLFGYVEVKSWSRVLMFSAFDHETNSSSYILYFQFSFCFRIDILAIRKKTKETSAQTTATVLFCLRDFVAIV